MLALQTEPTGRLVDISIVLWARIFREGPFLARSKTSEGLQP